jgi:hypothetical protein
MRSSRRLTGSLGILSVLLLRVPHHENSVWIQTVSLYLDILTRLETERLRYRFSKGFHVECAGQLFDSPSRRRMIVS